MNCEEHADYELDQGEVVYQGAHELAHRLLRGPVGGLELVGRGEPLVDRSARLERDPDRQVVVLEAHPTQDSPQDAELVLS